MAFEIRVIQGDITESECEAIVNAANNQLWMGSGVAGAIKAAGGDSIEEEAINRGPLMPGEAIATGAGRLPFRAVIHGAVMGQDLRTTDVLIRQTTLSCLIAAENLGLESLSFPAFGTGVGGFPMTACANIMVDAVSNYSDLARSLVLIEFCLFDESAYGLFKQAVKKRQSRGY